MLLPPEQDACWGGSAVLARDQCPLLVALFDGVEEADSLSYDAHKFISTGTLCSFFQACVFVLIVVDRLPES